MYGQFIRDILEGAVKQNSWLWMRKCHLKIPTEALIQSVKEQAVKTDYGKYLMKKSVDSPSCRMCSETGETISHVMSECSKLAQSEQKRRYDNVTRMVHWKSVRNSVWKSLKNGIYTIPQLLLKMSTTN